MRYLRFPVLVLALACSSEPDRGDDVPAGQSGSSARRDEAPVPLDAESPVEYPPALFEQGVGGTVVLRLFVTADGTVVPDSSRVVESSGHPALDSAALAGAPRLRYAPATRNGQPVAAPFTQPIIFRAPAAEGVLP